MAACSLRAWQPPYKLPLLHWCYHLSDWYHWASPWHHHDHQPATPWGLRAAAADFPDCLSSCLPAQYDEESCHWLSWGPHPQPEKQKIPLGQRRQTPPSLPQWQPSHRCLHGWPHQVKPPASFMLLTHCSSPPCWKNRRWQAWACSIP